MMYRIAHSKASIDQAANMLGQADIKASYA